MRTILIVDDEDKFTNVLKKFFVSLGYDVHTAADADSALKQFEELRPHVVLLDIILPGMWGVDLLKKMKKIDPIAAVIMVTAIADEETAKNALAAGAYDYITKPLNLDHVARLVSKLV